MEMTLENFANTYVKPAVIELARKLKAGEPLTDLEAEILMGIQVPTN